MSLVSGIAGGLVGGTIAKFATSALSSLFGGVNNRIIGTIVVPVTIREHHRDTMTITQHPVEFGAQVSDHAFMNPKTLQITIGYGAGTDLLRTAYNQFLALQSSRVPFSITTGKRKYANMLIESIDEETDQRTENILRLELHCTEVIMVKTQSAQAIAAAQANAPVTATPENVGSKQILSTPASWAGNVNAQSIPGVLA